MVKNIIDGLQLLVLAVGLFFAWDQAVKLTESIKAENESIEATNRNTQMSTWNAVAQQWLEMDKFFAEHPGLQQYIYSNASPPEDEKDIAEATGNYVLDFIDNALITGHYLKNSVITIWASGKILSRLYF
jgi:hypothetical protein